MQTLDLDGIKKYFKAAKIKSYLIRYSAVKRFASGARGRNRTGMGGLSPRDFKSLVSTYFTTRAPLANFFTAEYLIKLSHEIAFDFSSLKLFFNLHQGICTQIILFIYSPLNRSLRAC